MLYARVAAVRIGIDFPAPGMFAADAVAEIRKLGIAVLIREIFLTDAAVPVLHRAGVLTVGSRNRVVMRHRVSGGVHVSGFFRAADAAGSGLFSLARAGGGRSDFPFAPPVVARGGDHGILILFCVAYGAFLVLYARVAAVRIGIDFPAPLMSVGHAILESMLIVPLDLAALGAGIVIYGRVCAGSSGFQCILIYRFGGEMMLGVFHVTAVRACADMVCGVHARVIAVGMLLRLVIAVDGEI